MRFRTGIANVALLHRIIRSLSSLSRLCTIRFSSDAVHFIIPNAESKEGVQVWSSYVPVKLPHRLHLHAHAQRDGLLRETLFKDYRIESNNDNEIWLEISLDSLLKILKSADSSAGLSTDTSKPNSTALSDSEVSLKLNKRDNRPIFSFEIRGRTMNGKALSITHEINIQVLSKRRQDELKEPMCPTPDIHLMLPNLTDLRNVVSRLGHLAENIRISANHEGTLEIAVSDQSVELSTTWQNLHIPHSAADDDAEHEEQPPPNHFYSANVGIKALLKFLGSYLVGGTAIACICTNYCVIAYVYIGEVSQEGGVLTFFIPAKNDGTDID